jgi:DNA topoisomerase-1
MPKNLVIVESPAKAKTIQKYLGKDFQVESCYGHIADLPSKELGVDVDNNFKPNYKVTADKKAVVKKLSDLAKKADTIWLASDEDREGEAISWHLANELKLKNKDTKRIVFHEITKTAIDKAINNPRAINENLVNAQQARRVLDRLVGYQLSPVLWKKIKTGLSAGRVQSVSVRLIVEKEREIRNFQSKDSYHISAVFQTQDHKIIKAKLDKGFETAQAAEAFLNKNVNASFQVSNLETKPFKKSPAAPFTTSTLQQESARKLYMPVGVTMQVAQKLYEEGHITYMRTDSFNLSQDAIKASEVQITKLYGSQFSKPRVFTTKTKGAQEAHEAIRPTDMSQSTLAFTDRNQQRLYELIWKRTIASQMADAQLERTNVDIKASKHDEIFKATGEVIKFEGFLKVYLEGNDDEDEEQEGMLPAMKLGENLNSQEITATQRFSRPPSRYTEASLVKKLEELGIGRPSTYAPTISTIINRNYVEKGESEGEKRNYNQLKLKDNTIEKQTLTETFGSEKGKLLPTDIGSIVNDFLVKNFETILDYNFTAKVEEDFDHIAEGNKDWVTMMQEFYKHFNPKVKEIEETGERESGERLLGIDPKTGKNVYVRLGRYGALAQIGDQDDENKQFASLTSSQNISSLTLEDAMALFALPRLLGDFNGEPIEVNNGRYGPYLKYQGKFITLPKEDSPTEVTLEKCIEIINEKNRADAPIATYQEMPVQKGVGRFGPFLKWNGIYINVSKKYNFDHLSQNDINDIIADKIQKDIDKVIHHWAEEGITVEKGRWGTSFIIKGKTKIQLGKEIDASKLSIDDVKTYINNQSKSKKKAK